MADLSNTEKAESSTSYNQHSSNTDISPVPAPPPKAAPNMSYYHSKPRYPGHGPQPPTHHSGNGAGRFIHGFILCSFFTFTGFFVVNLILILILHPQAPIFQVTSISVSNFNTDSVLTGDWNISISVHNPNSKLRGYFSNFKVVVVNDDDNEMAMSFVPNFQLSKFEQRQIDVKASSIYVVNFISFQKWDLEKMSNERQRGYIMFGVRVSSKAEFKSSSLSTRNTRMLANCKGLKVMFQHNTATGTLENGGNPVTCQL